LFFWLWKGKITFYRGWKKLQEEAGWKTQKMKNHPLRDLPKRAQGDPLDGDKNINMSSIVERK
jgi:hypothetical protein